MGFFLDSFMPGTADSPSIVTLILPDGTNFRALATSDISISLGNTFGSFIPDVTALSDLSQIMNNQNVISWIGASTQLWKSTKPISFSLDLYLVNYKPNLGYEQKLKKLASLATMGLSSAVDVGPAGFNPQDWTTRVHGGYEPKFWEGNRGQILGNDDFDYGKFSTSMNDKYVEGGSSFDTKGTITVKIGSHFKLGNLIMTKLDIQPSIVEVYSPSVGGTPKPLYYRIGIGLQTNRAAVSTDLDGMFRS